MRPTATPVPVSPWERWSWAFAGIWLVFLTYPTIENAQAENPVAVTVVGYVLIAAFALVYMLGFGAWADRPWLAFGLLLATAAGTIPIIGVETIGMTPYLGVYAALQLPAPWWPRVTVLVALLPLLSLLVDADFPAFFFLMAWPIILGMALLRVFTEGERRADVARAELALVAERERVARDVHDVLGHSLTALSVKAELAGRLLDLDPERARTELESIQETARQALAEVRATVGGLRAGTLADELAAAPCVLADAGVRTEVHGEVADTDPRHRTLLAWVLREAVTNVVRHSGARSVTIVLGPTGLVVADDGSGMAGPEGHGLTGMRERVSAAGGTLSITGDPGTRLEVVLP